MRIIHVEDYFDPSAGYQINELLFASKDSDDEIILITSKDMTPFHKQYDYEKDREYELNTGVKIIRLDYLLKLSTRLILKKLNFIIDSLSPDLVFFHGIADFKDLNLYKRKRKYKIVRDCHMSWVASVNRLSSIFYMFFKIFFAPILNNTNKYEKVFALGIEEFEYLKRIGVSDNKIMYLQHGYNEDIMHFDDNGRKEVRTNYGFNDNDIVISYIGKRDFNKRPDFIFDIISYLKQEYIDSNNLKLIFIGPENLEYKEFLYRKMEKLNKKIKIIIDGPKPFNVLNMYYSASDICIFPKETSLSSIHAQVCGCPVIMEKHRSNMERVVDNGNLFDFNDHNQASIILQKIIDKKEFEKRDIYLSKLVNREYKNQISILKKIGIN